MTLPKKTYAETKQIDTPYGRAFAAMVEAEKAWKDNPESLATWDNYIRARADLAEEHRIAGEKGRELQLKNRGTK